MKFYYLRIFKLEYTFRKLFYATILPFLNFGKLSLSPFGNFNILKSDNELKKFSTLNSCDFHFPDFKTIML